MTTNAGPLPSRLSTRSPLPWLSSARWPNEPWRQSATSKSAQWLAWQAAGRVVMEATINHVVIISTGIAERPCGGPFRGVLSVNCIQGPAQLLILSRTHAVTGLKSTWRVQAQAA